VLAGQLGKIRGGAVSVGTMAGGALRRLFLAGDRVACGLRLQRTAGNKQSDCNC
jgi:hypothetical protein